MTTLGERIKLLREELGMSKTELAEIMGCDLEDIEEWECNRKVPHILQIKPLSVALETTTDYLLGVKERKNSII